MVESRHNRHGQMTTVLLFLVYFVAISICARKGYCVSFSKHKCVLLSSKYNIALMYSSLLIVVPKLHFHSRS